MTRIFSRTRFEGFHCWPNAPDEVAFLRANHRHEFHVRAWKIVRHDDRDVEFILFKRVLDRAIKAIQTTQDVRHWSCEKWAATIGQLVEADSVEVSEDGENGAQWVRSED